MNNSNLGLAFRGAVSGPPFPAEVRRALEQLSDGEQVELGRLIAKSAGVPDGDFPARTANHIRLEVVAWKGKFDETMRAFKATEDMVAEKRVAVARADAVVRRLAANGHSLKSVVRTGCAGVVLVMASLVGAIIVVSLIVWW